MANTIGINCEIVFCAKTMSAHAGVLLASKVSALILMECARNPPNTAQRNLFLVCLFSFLRFDFVFPFE